VELVPEERSLFLFLLVPVVVVADYLLLLLGESDLMLLP
jgi:hypothetical protein